MERDSSIEPAVLIVGGALAGGGAEARLARLAEHLFDGGADVAVLRDTGRLGKSHRGQIFHLRWKRRWSYLSIAIQLRRLIRNADYDVVFAFGLFPIAVASLALLGMTNRPKLIINEITRPLAQLGRVNILRRLVYKTLIKTLYVRGDLITANSIDGLRETCQIVGMDAQGGIRLPNIMDADHVRTLAMRRSPVSVSQERYIVWVGRLDEMKRVDTVIEAYARADCARECGLVIVGDGETRVAMERLAKRLGVQESVTFSGILENPLPIVSGSAAFVLASEYEGFSNAVLEAMFCDVPVITSYCSSDARDMCNQGAALGFEAGDVDHLAGQIARVIREREISQKLVRRARAYRAPHEMNRAIARYEEAIHSVL